ncbi:MAG: ABC transporter ATP-binding protein [Acidobacteriota bacterium]
MSTLLSAGAAPRTTRQILSRLSTFARPHQRDLWLALALLATNAVIETLVLPVLFASLLVSVVGPEVLGTQRYAISVFGLDISRLAAALSGTASRGSMLAVLAAAGVAVMLFKSSCVAGRLFLSHNFSFKLVRDLRARVFEHLLGQSADFFDRTRTGRLLSRLTGDVFLLQEGLGPPLTEIVQAPLTIAIALVVLLWLNWKLTLATLCVAPLVALFISWSGNLVRRLAIARQDRLADLNAHIAERLSAVRMIQVFGRERDELSTMRGLDRAYFREALRSASLAELMSPASEFVVAVGMLVGLVLGGISVLSGSMSREHFILFFAVAPSATTHLSRLARVGQWRQHIAGSASRLLDLLDSTSTVSDAPGAVVLDGSRGRVTFVRVSYRYPGGEDVLHDIDLDVAPGTTLAVVGPSGAGKTTFVNLVPRLFDPTSGRVLLDGVDLRGLTLASLRSQIGLVSQDAILFNHTVTENIRYGRPAATDADVRAAAEAANALEFIERLPSGWDTTLGERGASLSAGQRQRIAIARALVRDPRILILDEATSALDSVTERLVQEAVDRVIAGRTTFVIAHRLSTVLRAERILVLDEGRAVELGTHDELLGRCALYRRLHDAQFLARLRLKTS